MQCDPPAQYIIAHHRSYVLGAQQPVIQRHHNSPLSPHPRAIGRHFQMATLAILSLFDILSILRTSYWSSSRPSNQCVVILLTCQLYICNTNHLLPTDNYNSQFQYLPIHYIRYTHLGALPLIWTCICAVIRKDLAYIAHPKLLDANRGRHRSSGYPPSTRAFGLHLVHLD
jgi:hypothetical protein